MINLLPPAYKQEIVFAKRNAVALRYLQMTLAAAGLVGLIMIIASIKLSADTKRAESVLAPKDATIRALSQIEKPARELSKKLNQIKNLRSGQSHFSTLLGDLAKVTPKGIIISSLDLTGDQAKPLRITAVADSYESAVALREALVTSPRVAEADIEAIVPQGGTSKNLNVNVVLSFKPGQAR